MPAPETAPSPSPAQQLADEQAEAARAIIAASAAATIAALPCVRPLLPTGWHASCPQPISRATHTLAIDPPTDMVDATAYLKPHTTNDGTVAGWYVRVHNRAKRIGFPLYTEGGAHAAVFTNAEDAATVAITVLRIEAVPARLGRL